MFFFGVQSDCFDYVSVGPPFFASVKTDGTDNSLAALDQLSRRKGFEDEFVLWFALVF